MVARLSAFVVLGGAILACNAAAAGPGTPPIVFSADRFPAVSGEIYRIDSDGTRVDLSGSPFQDTVPAVAPNGHSVAFVKYRSGGAAVYVVGIDGSDLQQLAAPGLGLQPRELTWSPNSKAIAVISGEATSRLSVLGPGREGRVIARAKSFLEQPAWSPGGRLLTVDALGGTRAFTPAGKLAWRVPVFPRPGWSARGLFAGQLRSSLRVYDGRGRERFRFKGVIAAWSPTGTRIASLARKRLEVRTSRGLLVLRKSIPELTGHNGLVWADARRVVIGVYPRAIGVDVVTGKRFKASPKYFGTRSADGKLVAEATPAGNEFDIRVSALNGSSSQVYGRVPGCYDDQAYVAAFESLQFVRGRKSLVYASYCPEPFAALYAVAPDGSGLMRLTDVQEDELGPSWSPSGDHVVYTRFDYTGASCKGCPGSLAIADAGGSNRRILTTPEEPSYADSSPSWSPDGTQILFTRLSFTQPGELYVVPAAGGAAHDLGVAGSDSAWGPSRIAYVDFEHSPTTLWTARPDGTDRQKVATASGADVPYGPAWARDGRLAFIDGKATVAIVSGSVTQKVQLPFSIVNSIAWSPDGSRLVVSAVEPNNAGLDIYTVRTDGTDPRRLTKDMDAFSPSWR
jgi:Tol biopolymer transport system component